MLNHHIFDIVHLQWNVSIKYWKGYWLLLFGSENDQQCKDVDHSYELTTEVDKKLLTLLFKKESRS